MKTLILSANTGQGHNSCAKAIQETFVKHGDVCDVQDVFGLVSPKLSRTIAANHEKTYRHTPGLNNAGYEFLERHPKFFSQKQIVYRVMSIGRKQVAKCIEAGCYDTVICTHVLAAMCLTAAIQKNDVQVQSAFVATDYSCTPGINGTKLDYYFIPHESLIDDFMYASVPESQIIPTGIPVQSAFSPAFNKGSLKERFDIRTDHRHLLIMCGSMGCGPIPEMLRSISISMPDNWEVSVVCGTNQKLKNELDSEYQYNPRIHVRGYESQMPSLLGSADLYLTKPGGLSTSEAAACAVPMVFVDAVAGCEENNLRHFAKLGVAVAGNTATEAADLCLKLMEEPEALAAMTQKLRSSKACYAAEDIWCTLHQVRTA